MTKTSPEEPRRIAELRKVLLFVNSEGRLEEAPSGSRRVQQLEDALRESVNIAVEREEAFRQEQSKERGLIQKVKYSRKPRLTIRRGC